MRKTVASGVPGGGFYPGRNPNATSSVKEVVEKLRAEGKPQEGKMGSVVKAMCWGMLGAFGGSQIGLWSGRRAAQDVVNSSGREKEITKNLSRAMRDAATEVAASSGRPIKSFKLPGMSQQDWDEKDDDGDHVEEEEKEEAGLAPPEGFYSNETVDDRSREGGAPSGDSDAPASRWDELRQAKPAAASSWDTIRDSSLRASLPPAARAPAQRPSASTPPPFEDEKDRRKREFEALMDKERQGGEDGFGNDSKWK